MQKRKTEKYVVCIGTGIYAEVEQHTNKEMPKIYPERIIYLGKNVLALMDCHSQYFIPTPENRAKLNAKIQACRSWYYVHIIHHGHERS